MDADTREMLERLVHAARRAYMKGFAAGSGGNVSIRVQGRVYISPGGICLGDLGTEDMIALGADGESPAGSRRPSKEAGMHLACYRSRPDIRCLFHLHSPYSIAAACRRQIAVILAARTLLPWKRTPFMWVSGRTREKRMKALRTF